MNQFLAVSILGAQCPQLLRDISQAAVDNACLIDDSRMILLGREIGLQFLVVGTWDAIARFETNARKLSDSLGLAMTLRRTDKRQARNDHIPYAIDAITADKSGIVNHLADFFVSRKIEIYEMNTRAYSAPETGAPLFAIQLSIAVPVDMPIATLREDFMDLCDRINLDAIIEPHRN